MILENRPILDSAFQTTISFPGELIDNHSALKKHQRLLNFTLKHLSWHGMPTICAFTQLFSTTHTIINTFVTEDALEQNDPRLNLGQKHRIMR